MNKEKDMNVGSYTEENDDDSIDDMDRQLFSLLPHFTCFPQSYESSFANNETNIARGSTQGDSTGVKILVRGDLLGALNCLLPQLNLIPSPENAKVPILDADFSLFSDKSNNFGKLFAEKKYYLNENKTCKISPSIITETEFEREKSNFHISLEKHIRDELSKKISTHESHQSPYEKQRDWNQDRQPYNKSKRHEPVNRFMNSSSFNEIVGFEYTLKHQKIETNTNEKTELIFSNSNSRNSMEDGGWKAKNRKSKRKGQISDTTIYRSNLKANEDIVGISFDKITKDNKFNMSVPPAVQAIQLQPTTKTTITTQIQHKDLNEQYINQIVNLLSKYYPDRFEDFKQIEQIVNYFEKSFDIKLNQMKIAPFNSNLPILNISKCDSGSINKNDESSRLVSSSSSSSSSSPVKKRLYSSVVKCSSQKLELKKTSPKKKNTVINLTRLHKEKFSAARNLFDTVPSNCLPVKSTIKQTEEEILAEMEERITKNLDAILIEEDPIPQVPVVSNFRVITDRPVTQLSGPITPNKLFQWPTTNWVVQNNLQKLMEKYSISNDPKNSTNSIYLTQHLLNLNNPSVNLYPRNTILSVSDLEKQALEQYRRSDERLATLEKEAREQYYN